MTNRRINKFIKMTDISFFTKCIFDICLFSSSIISIANHAQYVKQLKLLYNRINILSVKFLQIMNHVKKFLTLSIFDNHKIVEKSNLLLLLLLCKIMHKNYNRSQ